MTDTRYIETIDAPLLNSRVEAGDINEWFVMKNFPYKVALNLPSSNATDAEFETYGEGWIRVRDFVGENVPADQYQWTFYHRTIAFYFTDQLIAAKARLLV